MTKHRLIAKIQEYGNTCEMIGYYDSDPEGRVKWVLQAREELKLIEKEIYKIHE